MKKKYIYLIVIFLIIACLAAFGRIAGNDFINFDDNLYITENHHVQSGFNFENIKWAFTTFHHSYWHPLTWLSHMLDWNLFGANASGHHLVNLMLHIGSVLLLFLFLNRTTNNIWPSAFAAALFALHPLRVESVAWAAERKDVLSIFFGMASIYAYSFYAENLKMPRYFICLIFFALTLMSKPMLVTLPFVLLLLDYWPLGRWQRALSAVPEVRFKMAGRLVWEKMPFFILTIAISILAFRAQGKIGAMVKTESIHFMDRLSNAVFSYVMYLGKIFWPINLAVYYPFEVSLPFGKVLISGLILILITVMVLYYIRKMPFLFVGLFWYVGTLIPVIGIVQVGSQSMADRYTYLPSVGIGIMLTWGISFLIKSENIRKKVLFPSAIALLAVLAVLTWQQCSYWKNSIILFTQALKVTKNNDKMHHNLGTSFFKEGKVREALYHFNKAININPNYLSYNSRGDIYARAGMHQKAIDDFNKAISLKPDFTEGYYNRGLTYDRIGNYQLAIEDFNKVISLKNDYVDAYNNRGIVYAKLGQYQVAIDDFTKAIFINPYYAHAYANRGITYFKQGKNELGCQDVKKVCEAGNCAALKEANTKGLCR